MAIRKTSFINGEYYHIYNRGNSKQIIFRDKTDYLHFVKLLYLCNSERSISVRDITKDSYNFDRGSVLVALGAYCLMPNHFHLLITPSDYEKSVSKFMQKLTTAYSMYYNKKYKRTGSLFEGKFKAQHLNSDRYLKYIFSYIHLNPLKLINKKWKEEGFKNRLVVLNHLQEYVFSSYLDYINQTRKSSVILERSKFPNYFKNPAIF